MSIFDDIASGYTRLTPTEDLMLWRMREERRPWPEIERAIRLRRSHLRTIGPRGIAARRHAIEQRALVRQERAQADAMLAARNGA